MSTQSEQMPVQLIDVVSTKLAEPSSTPTAAPLDTPATITTTAAAEAEAAAELARKGPGGKHDNMRTYTPDEAALVFRLVEAHQPRWTHIAKLVSDHTGQARTAASIRNYYKRFCASKAIADRDSATKKLNRCQQCGQIKRGHICSGVASIDYVAPTDDAAAGDIAVADVAAPSEQAPPKRQRLALAGNGEEMPPLAAASLEVLMPLARGCSPYPGLDSLSTPAPVSANFLHGLLAPSPFSFTPALPPSADPSRSAPFGSSSRSQLVTPPPEPIAEAIAEVQTAGDDAARAAREVETDAEATEVEASHEASRAASPLVTAL